MAHAPHYRKAKRFTASYTKAYADNMYKQLGVRVLVFTMRKDESEDLTIAMYAIITKHRIDLMIFSGMITTSSMKVLPPFVKRGRNGKTQVF